MMLNYAVSLHDKCPHDGAPRAFTATPSPALRWPDRAHNGHLTSGA